MNIRKFYEMDEFNRESNTGPEEQESLRQPVDKGTSKPITMTKHEIEHVCDGLELLKNHYRTMNNRIAGSILYKEVDKLRAKMFAMWEEIEKTGTKKKMSKEDMNAFVNDFKKNLFGDKDVS